MASFCTSAIIGIVRLVSVDDDCLQVFVPALRLAEQFAQFVFAVESVFRKAFDESFGHVVKHVGIVGVTALVGDCRADVVFQKRFDCVHCFSSCK